MSVGCSGYHSLTPLVEEGERDLRFAKSSSGTSAGCCVPIRRKAGKWVVLTAPWRAATVSCERG